MGSQIYVETVIRADQDELWRRTQDAADHTRWDLRFTRIEDITAQSDDAPLEFRYELRLPGLVIGGTGRSVGERQRPDGTRTSALRFGSPHPLSLIRSGSGWWRYVPTDHGIRFLTGYDYTPGWARLGPVVDRAGFRRLVGWMTAWSFDRLRMWLEDGPAPEAAARRWALDTGLRALAVGSAIRLALRHRGTTSLALGGLAVLAPDVPGTPRARRCLRRPPDRLGPPETLETLS